MWDIDAPVGKNKANRSDDVRLVQGLLRAIVASGMSHAPAIPRFRTPLLHVSGVFDESTESQIKMFQQAMNHKHPGRYQTDGVVTPLHSPAKVDWALRSSDGKNSTLAALNLELRAMNKYAHESLGEKLPERLL
jgi:peptidoglycan hydrolase-like protein with peptidoglycan-binding domain